MRFVRLSHPRAAVVFLVAVAVLAVGLDVRRGVPAGAEIAGDSVLPLPLPPAEGEFVSGVQDVAVLAVSHGVTLAQPDPVTAPESYEKAAAVQGDPVAAAQLQGAILDTVSASFDQLPLRGEPAVDAVILRYNQLIASSEAVAWRAELLDRIGSDEFLEALIAGDQRAVVAAGILDWLDRLSDVVDHINRGISHLTAAVVATAALTLFTTLLVAGLMIQVVVVAGTLPACAGLGGPVGVAGCILLATLVAVQEIQFAYACCMAPLVQVIVNQVDYAGDAFGDAAFELAQMIQNLPTALQDEIGGVIWLIEQFACPQYLPECQPVPAPSAPSVV